MTHIISFTHKKRKISTADKLLQEFVDICLITDKEKRQKQFEALRQSIFNYVITRR